jgi:hypothetical protein
MMSKDMWAILYLRMKPLKRFAQVVFPLTPGLIRVLTQNQNSKLQTVSTV